MKINKYICILILTSFFTSCEDYLDKVQESDGLQEGDVFSSLRLAGNFLDGAYGVLITEVSAKNGQSDYLPAMTMAGEGYPGRLNNNVPLIYNQYAQGDYLSLINSTGNQAPIFVTRYTNGWKGIRIANSFLANADLIADGTEEEVNQLKGQAYLFRAFFYHLMTKRHGGLIYLKENLDLNSDLDFKRESYESNFNNMIEDLDLAIDLLPKEWPVENIGRLTKGVAMALKSRVTLFGASPLANTSNDLQLWKNAATAASDLINFANTNGLYNLANASAASNLDVGHDGADLFVAEPTALLPYRNIFVGQGKSRVFPDEVIFMESNEIFRIFGNFVNPLPRFSLTTGYDLIKGNGTPMNIGALANFVDKFETKNGLSISDDPTYNPQEPFINRDPRFYNAILFDGAAWQHTTAGPLNGTGFANLAIVNKSGEYGLDLANPATPASLQWRVQNTTGYRIRKWTPNGAYWRSGTNIESDFHINNIIFRMAEIYLNFAEAANEAYGPSGAVPNSSLTALEAVNIIRNRVGMPDIVTGSKDILRERIRNERAVELCFEGHRYDDIRRWKIAHLDENLKVEFLEMRWQGGESAIYPSGFSYENVEQDALRKTFTDRNYWWPIPSTELEAVPSFGQTTGW